MLRRLDAARGFPASPTNLFADGIGHAPTRDEPCAIQGFGTLAIRAGDRGAVVAFHPYQSLTLGIESEVPQDLFESPVLVERIAKATGCDEGAATERLSIHLARTVRAATDRVRPRSVPFGNLGLLWMHHMPAYEGTNPRTGETVHVRGRRLPFFHGAHSLLLPEDTIPATSEIADAAIASWDRPPVSFATIESDLAAIDLPAFAPSDSTEREDVEELSAELRPDRLLAPLHEGRLAVFLEGAPRVEWLVPDATARHPVDLESFIRAAVVAISLRRERSHRIAPHDAVRIIDHIVDRSPPDAWTVLSAVLVPSISL